MPRRKETQPTKGHINTFRQLQDVQNHFRFQNQLEVQGRPEEVLGSLKGEVEECLEALQANDFPEIKSELADIVIFAATVANSLHFDLHKSIVSLVSSLSISDESSLDVSFSALQNERKKMPRSTKTLIAQESIDLSIQMDRVEQSFSFGQDDRLKTALGELTLVVVDIANERGIDLQGIITQKIERNFIKYNPATARELIDSGLTPFEALAEQKRRWDRRRDKDFLK